MSPKPYRLGRRGEAAEETRQRIVQATFALHGEQGIAATSMKQIAARAGVSIGTVYHHFPTYENAIQACGTYAMATAPLPTAALFTGLETVEERIERLAVETFSWFDRVPGFAHIRCDQDHFPSLLRPFVQAEEANRTTMMQEALTPWGVGARESRIAATLLDLSIYHGLRNAALDCGGAARQITEIIIAWLKSVQATNMRRTEKRSGRIRTNRGTQP
jgi:AcrR family transcriptional regulator